MIEICDPGAFVLPPELDKGIGRLPARFGLLHPARTARTSRPAAEPRMFQPEL